MRTLTAQETIVVAEKEYTVHLRVKIANASATLVDYTDFLGKNWVREVEYEDDVDQPVAVATITLDLDDFLISLYPLVSTSAANNTGGSYAALLEPMREVTIETMTVPLGQGTGAGTWKLVFHGDTLEIDAPNDVADGTLTVQCRDLGGRLQDLWLEADGTDDTPSVRYALVDTAVETVMQAILDDWGPGSITLYVPSSPGWAITGQDSGQEYGYGPGKVSVLEAITKLADMIGWVVRYKFDSVTGTFRLTFYEPDREKTTPDLELAPGQILRFNKFARSVAGIRNRIRVYYKSDPSAPQASEVEVEDATSIAAWGVRYMEIDETEGSAIDNAIEATDLANAALSDLKNMKADGEPETLFRYDIEREDLIRLTGRTRVYDANTDVSVVSVRHRISSNGEHTSAIAVRASGPIGKYQGWWDKGMFDGRG